MSSALCALALEAAPEARALACSPCGVTASPEARVPPPRRPRRQSWCEFGIAHAWGRVPEQGVMHTGTMAGTPGPCRAKHAMARVLVQE